jgi:methylmalonyl-CoA/ethylmalonyl-CoA epimerase
MDMNKEKFNSEYEDRSLEAIEDLIVELDHIAIAVEDLDAAIGWYQRTLGFNVVDRRITQGDHTSMISAVLKCGSAVVVLVQGTTPDSQVSRFIEHFGPGVQHLAFQVSDMDAALQRVEAAGATLDVGLIKGDGIQQAFLQRTPDSGVRVEIIERRGGEFSDRTVEHLYREMENKMLY